MKIKVNSLAEGYTALKEAYMNDDICMYDMLAGVEVEGLSMENVVSLYAMLVFDSDGDKIVRINEEDGIYERFYL